VMGRRKARYRCTVGLPQVYHYTPFHTILEVIMTKLYQAWRGYWHVSVSRGRL